MIKAVSFDFYGVMYSNFDWGVINERIRSDEIKVKEFEALVQAANDGLISNDQFRIEVERLAADEKHPDKPAVHAEPIVNTALMELMAKLKTKNGLKLAILSNGGHGHVSSVLEEQDVLKYFDLIATSAELPCYKPQPEAFQYVAEYFGVENHEVLHVDDSPRHIQGAKEAGVQALLYTDLATLESEIQRVLS